MTTVEGCSKILTMQLKDKYLIRLTSYHREMVLKLNRENKFEWDVFTVYGSEAIEGSDPVIRLVGELATADNGDTYVLTDLGYFAFNRYGELI